MTTARIVIAWCLMAFAAVSWPVASLTFAKSEPQFILALSELALLYEAFNALQNAYDRRNQEDQE